MRRHGLFLPLFVLLLLPFSPFVGTAAPAFAQPLPRERVPEPLAPWAEWVLHGHEDRLCPFLHGSPGITRCAWPGRLELVLEAGQGTFSQSWTVEVESAVPLPGDAGAWPQDLTVDGRPAVAVSRGGRPVVPLAPGTHRVAGRFQWEELPEGLAVPPETGLLEVRLAGAAVPFPRRDGAGRLLLRRADGAETEGERLEVTVQRRFADAVPARLTTRVELSVSGRAREVSLADPLLEGFVPLALDSPLPARLEAGGALTVQVRPGRWSLTLESRSEGPVEALGPRSPEGPWAAEEIWVFDARPALRLVDVEGVPPIDPRQTTLPEDWKSLPAYRLTPGDRLELRQRRRGDEDPPPDRLTLHRVLWLDFDGGGFSVQDVVGGVMRRSWRLEMAPPTRLERVVIDGVDQVLTRREGSEGVGLEVRRGNVLLAAESRLEERGGPLSAVGWEHGFQEVSADLHLPPGWRLLATTGVDEAARSWLSRWTLLDFFLVLILALAFGRLFGRSWGAIALVTLVLVHHEAGAPLWIWFPALLAAALARYLPAEGRARRVFRGLFWLASAGVLLITVPFLVEQVRQAIYPVLENPGARLGQEGGLWQDLTNLASQGRIDLKRVYGGVPGAVSVGRAAGYLDEVAQVGEDVAAPAPESELPQLAAAEEAPVQKVARRKGKAEVGSLNLQDLDPGAVVNTGGGLPAWEWGRVRLTWKGPVDPGQTMRLLLVSPGVGRLWALLRVLLLALLVLRLLSAELPALARRLAPRAAAVGLVLLSGLAGAVPARAQMPSPELLEELRSRLLAAPECAPACAESPRLVLEIGAGRLAGRLEVGAGAATAVPLPGGTAHWLPAAVRVDGETAGAAAGPGDSLWVAVTPGRHVITFEGPLPDREVVQLPLPLRPHRVEARGDAWTLEGVGRDGVPDASLRLVRVRRGPAAREAALEAQRLPPFLEVERTLILGLEWQVATRVRRLSPPGTPVLASIPLLPGESVISEGTRVEDGRVRLNLAPAERGAAWIGALEARETLDLEAADNPTWTEVWRLDASQLWHVDASGIPPVHPPESEDVRVPEWRPWPGETLRLAVSRPAGIDGRSLALDRSELLLEPGRRSREARLLLSLRSSRGGRHAIRLPEDAELTAVSIDGRGQPIRQDAGRVTLPLTPGSQTVELGWLESRGLGAVFRTPQVDLGATSVNALIRVQPPPHRWILWTWGPRAGPAVLFWSLLVVILLLAAGLGRVPLTPLGTLEWALLGVGLSQLPVPAAATVAVWLLALGLRRRWGATLRGRFLFDLSQIALVVLTAAALLCLFWGVQKGLLGRPEMQIAGNGSHAGELRWFADRAAAELPAAGFFSLPLWVYRLAMLAWALWLAQALLGWLRWGWECFTAEGAWRKLLRRKGEATP